MWPLLVARAADGLWHQATRARGGGGPLPQSVGLILAPTKLTGRLGLSAPCVFPTRFGTPTSQVSVWFLFVAAGRGTLGF